MENKDDIFEQFKTAANNAEQKEFSAVDKVWNRVENKLDNKLLTKENTLWKKLAVAASLLLVVSIGFHFLTNENKVTILDTNVVTIDKKESLLDSATHQPIVTVEEIVNPVIKANAEIILKNQIVAKTQVAVQDTITSTLSKMALSDSKDDVEYDAYKAQKPAVAASIVVNGYAKQKDNARGVRQDVGYLDNSDVYKESKQTSKKEAPLVVIDDKVSTKLELGKLDPNEIDNILVLPDPLYIINGVEYTEKELFGPNPTSPYAPLNQQNIETLSILQNEKAIEVYGEKGKKGVVIIATKGGKPTAKKK